MRTLPIVAPSSGKQRRITARISAADTLLIPDVPCDPSIQRLILPAQVNGFEGPMCQRACGRQSFRRLPPGCLHAFISPRSEEHTSELQSLMRISYAVFCLNKKINNNKHMNKSQYLYI